MAKKYIKVFNISNPQGNVDQNKTSPQPSKNGYYKKKP
jgi:hypothetical protein